MVDSKHDLVSKPEKHDWTFFAFFAIALILIASAIVWATAKAGLFNANGLDDDNPSRISSPAVPVPAVPDQSSKPQTSSSNDAVRAAQPISPNATDNITPSAGAPAPSQADSTAEPVTAPAQPAGVAEGSK